MNKKLKDLLTRNIGLKILALVFSLFLWFFVVSVNDPEQTQTFTAAVQVTNADVLEQTGEYYQVADGKTTVTFQATAKRSILDKLTSADFTATADMNFLDREKGRIPVEISVNRYVTQVNLSTRARYLNVVIGEKTSSKFVIEGEVKGAPADGFAVSSVAVSPNIITVDGPSTKVKQISRVVATVDVDGMSKDVTEAVVPTFLDENGDAIDTSDLTINLSSVQVTAEINSVKAVAIKVDTTGELGEGLELDKISTDPSTVTIVGSSSILNDITDITIPSTVVDLSTITEDFETTVDITRYLPDGVSLLNSKEGTVKIQVDVISHQEKVFVVPTANITLTNVANGYKAEFTAQSIDVTISGLETKLDALSATEITGSVDCSGLSEGAHKVNVQLNLDEGLTASTVTAEVDIKTDTASQNTGENGNTTGTDTQNGGSSSSGGSGNGSSGTGTGSGTGSGSSSEKTDSQIPNP